jgi:hypothetical protein
LYQLLVVYVYVCYCDVSLGGSVWPCPCKEHILQHTGTQNTRKQNN